MKLIAKVLLFGFVLLNGCREEEGGECGSGGGGEMCDEDSDCRSCTCAKDGQQGYCIAPEKPN